MRKRQPVIHMRNWGPDTDGVYIGRPRTGQPWQFGNPFRWKPGMAATADIDQYRTWLLTSNEPRARWQREHLHTLRGKVLVCFCAPRPCHGDVIADVLARAEEIAQTGYPWRASVPRAIRLLATEEVDHA